MLQERKMECAFPCERVDEDEEEREEREELR
jgi:hypothetical protein